jgi:hypothetical protein
VHDGVAGWPFTEEGSYQVVQDLLLLLDAGLEPQVSIDPYFTIDTVLHTFTDKMCFLLKNDLVRYGRRNIVRLKGLHGEVAHSHLDTNLN